MEDFARLRPLIATSMDVGSTVNAVLDRLDDADVAGNMRITLLSDGELLPEGGPKQWDLDLGKKQCVAVEETKGQKRARNLDLELVMSAATWTEIALGRLAPLEAFSAGRLRLRGDAELANRLYEHLKGDDGGITRICK